LGDVDGRELLGDAHGVLVKVGTDVETEIPASMSEGRNATIDGRQADWQGESGVRVVITGACGLLGRHIAERSVAAGQNVRGVVLPGEDTSFR